MGVTTNNVPLIGVGNQGASPVGPNDGRGL